MKASLTTKQAKCLAFITRYIRENYGVGPSYDVIMDGLDLKSRSGAYAAVQALIERGYIRTIPHRARSIEVLHPCPGEERIDFSARLSVLTEESFQRVQDAVTAEAWRRRQLAS